LDSDARSFIFDAQSDQVSLDASRLRDRLERPGRTARERLTVDLDADIADQLSVVCAKLRCTKSDFVREVIAEALRALDL